MEILYVLLYLVLLGAGFWLLVKGSDYFVDGASGIAVRFQIPQIIIGLTIVAMGTSLPEAAVSITAAFEGNADITIGNIVGSNILNIFIILGIASVIVPIAVQPSTVKYEIPYMILCSVLLVILGLDGTIGFVDGLIFWAAFILYLIYLFLGARKNKEEQETKQELKLWKQIVFVIGGMAAIILGSKLAVYGATEIARLWGVSERFIGLTIVALGTSLPELFTSVTAARKGNADIAIGNIVGSNIFNILFVIGTTAFITKVPYESKFLIDGYITIGSAVVLLLCSLRKKKLTRADGILMLVLYAAYFAYLCLF